MEMDLPLNASRLDSSTASYPRSAIELSLSSLLCPPLILLGVEWFLLGFNSLLLPRPCPLYLEVGGNVLFCLAEWNVLKVELLLLRLLL